jgi:hypothetical protein
MSAISRRSGIYRILDGDIDLGTEAWSEEAGESGARLTSVVMRTGPEPFEEEIEIEVDVLWRPVRLTVDRSSALGTRRYIGRQVGGAWISQIFREQGTLKTVTLEYDAMTHVDYFTPHTNRITIQRLDLDVGGGGTIDVVFIDPDSFVPVRVRQTYTRLPDSAGTIGGAQAVRHYRYEGSSGFRREITVDGDGVILRYDGLFELIDL